MHLPVSSLLLQIAEMVENRISSVAARCPVSRGFHRRLQLLCARGVPRDWELNPVARELQGGSGGGRNQPAVPVSPAAATGSLPVPRALPKPNPAGTCPLPGGISDTKTVRVAHRGL